MRRTGLLALAALSGCASTPLGGSDCARLHANSGYAEVDRLAGELVRLGNAITGQWRICGADPVSLAAFQADVAARNLRANRAYDQNGGCVLIPVSLAPTSSNVREASDLICRVAAVHHVAFVSWASAIDDRLLTITPDRWSVEPLGDRRFRRM
jgi:hypothetical protein